MHQITIKRDEENFLVEKDSLGRLVKRRTTIEENADKRNYNKADNINYLDGDFDTKLNIDDWSNETSEDDNQTNEIYELNQTSLISDQARVYKGGSWKDRAYWMVPGTRRFLDQQQSTSTIGFRCVMDRLGPPSSDLKENRRYEVDWNRKRRR